MPLCCKRRWTEKKWMVRVNAFSMFNMRSCSHPVFRSWQCSMMYSCCSWSVHGPKVFACEQRSGIWWDPPPLDSCFGDIKLLGDSWFTCDLWLPFVEDADLCAIALKVTGGEQFWMVCSCIPPGLPCAVALGWCFVHWFLQRRHPGGLGVDWAPPASRGVVSSSCKKT